MDRRTDDRKRKRSGVKERRQGLLTELYVLRDGVNCMYFGGEMDEDSDYRPARFVAAGAPKSKSDYEKIWLPFYKNLYCRFTSSIDPKDRWPMVLECVELFAIHKNVDIDQDKSKDDNDSKKNPNNLTVLLTMKTA